MNIGADIRLKRAAIGVSAISSGIDSTICFENWLIAELISDSVIAEFCISSDFIDFNLSLKLIMNEAIELVMNPMNGLAIMKYGIDFANPLAKSCIPPSTVAMKCEVASNLVSSTCIFSES